MFTFLLRNPRLLLLANVMIVVAGVLGTYAMPRMEDPLLTTRAASITTLLPGADAERVEALVTEKIEEELKEIEEIKDVNSISRQGVSYIIVELADSTDKIESAQIWSRVRDKIDDARRLLPAEAERPEFDTLDIKAYALIVALRWEADGEPRYGLLRRLAEELKDDLDGVSGTEKTDIFGDPEEEILVTIHPGVAASMNLSPEQISRAIANSDSKTSAGQLRGDIDEMLVSIDGEINSVSELSQIPIQLGGQGSVVQLSDIATVERTVRRPLNAKVLASGQPAIAIGAFVNPSKRLDHWRGGTLPVIEEFKQQLPPGIVCEVVFDQNRYVNARMNTLTLNLIFGTMAVFAMNFLVLGWRSSWVVSLSLPLCVLAVMFGMYVSDIPIHQMSISGLIIATGLIVDNAIVMVDEIMVKLRQGMSRTDAVASSCKHLAMPLLGATATTVLSFAPIALMPGPSGEFVGSIATVAIISVAFSLIMALTILAAIAGLVLKGEGTRGWFHDGISIPLIERIYSAILNALIRVPTLGIVLSLVLPIAGFCVFPQLREQFFPPADRNQFQLEIELAGTGSIQETEEVAHAIRAALLQYPEIEQVTWFLGESAPPFYYNVIPNRTNTPRYGQAIVDCTQSAKLRDLIRSVQQQLDQDFPQISCLALQLEQGPPFTAPIEVQLFGHDPDVLRQLGEQVRLVLSETPNVIQTRSDFNESLPTVSLAVDEQQARMIGLSNTAIAAGLNSMLEGTIGGSILEDSEEIPIRVRLSDQERGQIDRIASLDLIPVGRPVSETLPADRSSSFSGVPLGAISKLGISLERGAVSRQNGRRMNEVQAFIPAGILPAVVQDDFLKRLTDGGFQLPQGYSMSFAGAEAKRNDAFASLIVNVGVLVVLMITTLVFILNSFRLTALLFSVALLAAGSSIGALYLADMNWGFMSVVGIMGMTGIAVNDSIVILAALNALRSAGNLSCASIIESVVNNTRHVIATSVTTVAGFTPLILSGGDFWPPVAITISGGVIISTFLALVYIPCMYRLMYRTESVPVA